MSVHAAMAGDRIGTTRGGREVYERRELSRRAEPAQAGRHGRGAIGPASARPVLALGTEAVVDVAAVAVVLVPADSAP